MDKKRGFFDDFWSKPKKTNIGFTQGSKSTYYGRGYGYSEDFYDSYSYMYAKANTLYVKANISTWISYSIKDIYDEECRAFARNRSVNLKEEIKEFLQEEVGKYIYDLYAIMYIPIDTIKALPGKETELFEFLSNCYDHNYDLLCTGREHACKAYLRYAIRDLLDKLPPNSLEDLIDKQKQGGDDGNPFGRLGDALRKAITKSTEIQDELSEYEIDIMSTQSTGEDTYSIKESKGDSRTASQAGFIASKDVIGESIMNKIIKMEANFFRTFVEEATSVKAALLSSGYTSILEAEDISEILELEYMNPKIMKFLLDDIQATSYARTGQFDIYIDVSGSMDSGENGNLTMAKAIAYSFIKRKYAANVYVFNGKCFKLKRPLVQVPRLVSNGGTVFEDIRRMVIMSKRPSLVLTDGQSEITKFIPNLLFMDMDGNNMNGLVAPAHVKAKYISEKQLFNFDQDQKKAVAIRHKA